MKSNIKFEELYEKLSKRFDNRSLRITYKDENSKQILMKGDKDLKDAIESKILSTNDDEIEIEITIELE